MEEQAKQSKQAKSSKHMKASNPARRKLIERVVWSMLLIVALAVAGGVYIIVDSTKAINDYREAVYNQYSEAVNAKSVGVPVELRKVWLADKISPKYRQTQALKDSYSKLLTDIKDYNATRQAHDKLVKIFNEGTEKSATLSGEALGAVQNYKFVIKDRYPKETERLSAMTQLEDKVSSSTTFAEVSADLSQVLHDNDKWLDGIRNSINSNQNEFQNKINSI